MSQKKIHVPITTVEDYLQIHRGIFGLTDEECRVLSGFIREQVKIEKEGLSVNPFSAERRKMVAEQLGRKNPTTLNNYIKSLKDKSAIHPVEGGYEVHRILLPGIFEGTETITLTVRWREE